MMLFAVISWWYTAGWAKLVERAKHGVSATFESFSVVILLSSLFEPFRQIDANSTSSGPLNARARAFSDRLFSRVFGAVIRTFMIIFGLLAALFMTIVGFIRIVVWPFIPFLPVIGVVLTVMGVSP
ncbi:MAG TPA: hypothetical protein VMR45_00350 [Patescibacteria group bacterium]|nr:hypothetical protein [Patescibacteria group bacterium]